VPPALEKSWLDKTNQAPKSFSGAGLPNRAKGQIFHHAKVHFGMVLGSEKSWLASG